jgi:1-acyl-sn-glycerol-3-phosphate acyltransferase
MIRAKHHIVIYPLFKWLTGFLLRRNFNSIHIEGSYHDNKNPILLIANHISWWDGFWIMYLNLKILHRKFHFMMLEQQLKKHWYFQYSGAYSVKKKSRSIIQSLRYTNKLLQDSRNMVFLFPQGKIHSLYNNSIKFEKGVQKIIDHTMDEVQIVYVANLIDYFSHSKPNLFIYMKAYLAKDLKGNLAEAKYKRFFDGVLCQHKIKTS